MYGLADHRAATLQLYVYMYRLHFTSASMRDYAALTLLSLPLALLEVCQVVVRISSYGVSNQTLLSIELTNRPVRLRDQPKHSELIASYVKKVHWPTTQALCSSCCAYYLYFYRLALDSPSKCVSDWQFSAILLECMASLIIVLSRCSVMSVPKQTRHGL